MNRYFSWFFRRLAAGGKIACRRAPFAPPLRRHCAAIAPIAGSG
jgi:hypothetical protein